MSKGGQRAMREVREEEDRSLNRALLGSTLVNRHGAIVLPSKARRDLGLVAGDRLLVFRYRSFAALLLLPQPDGEKDGFA